MDLNPIQRKMNAIRAIEQTLTHPVHHITSLPALEAVGGRPGIVITAPRALVAKLLQSGSHRLSTPEEIAVYEADEKRAVELANASKPPAPFEAHKLISRILEEK
jgi:hypothetical protein